jgi:hypothetical protein
MYQIVIPSLTALVLLIRQIKTRYLANALLLASLAMERLLHGIAYVVPEMLLAPRIMQYAAVFFLYRSMVSTYMCKKTSRNHWFIIGTLLLFDVGVWMLGSRLSLTYYLAMAFIVKPFCVGGSTRIRFLICLVWMCANDVFTWAFLQLPWPWMMPVVDMSIMGALLLFAHTMLRCEQCFIIATHHKYK